MFTYEHRPKRFSEVVGQQEAVTILQAVAKSPVRAPRAYVLHGPRGLGKTSLSRILARSLTCESFREEPCLACPSCVGFSETSMGYMELDSTQVGNVEYMRKFKEILQYSEQDGYRVICFDEIQAASSASQGVLLKLLEDGPRNCFFVLCTTAVDKLMPEIYSRVVPVMFSPVADDQMRAHLIRLCELEKLAYDNDILDWIIMFSLGHVRDATMKLDLYRQIGDKEKFHVLVRVPEKDILEILAAARTGSREVFTECVQALTVYPLAYLRRGFEMVILNLLRKYSGVNVRFFSDEYDKVLGLYGNEVMSFLPLLSSDWVYSCFRNDLSFNGLMWYLYAMLAKKVEAAPSRMSGSVDRYRNGANTSNGVS